MKKSLIAILLLCATAFSISAQTSVSETTARLNSPAVVLMMKETGMVNNLSANVIDNTLYIDIALTPTAGSFSKLSDDEINQITEVIMPYFIQSFKFTPDEKAALRAYKLSVCFRLTDADGKTIESVVSDSSKL